VIPPALAAAGGVDGAARALGRLPLGEFRPFVVVVLAAAGRGLWAAWSGADLDLHLDLPREQPLVSSSFCTEEVRRNRVAVFRRMREAAGGAGTTALHLDYHRSHEPAAGPHSPCMHRDDAATVSFSWVEVDERQIRFHYAAHSPCLAAPAPAVVLTRLAA
jgi:hypothetical protein